MILTSIHNPRLMQVLKWRDRRDRDRDQAVVIEGYRALSRALAAGFPVTDVYYCPEMYQGVNEASLLERLAASGSRLVQVAPGPIARIAYRDRPEGLLGIGRQRRMGLGDIPVRETPPFYLVAEQIEKRPERAVLCISVQHGRGYGGTVRTDGGYGNELKGAVPAA